MAATYENFYEICPGNNIVIIEPTKMYALGLKSIIECKLGCSLVTHCYCEVAAAIEAPINNGETDLVLLSIPSSISTFMIKKLIKKIKRHFLKARIVAYGYTYNESIVEKMFALKIDAILQLDDSETDITVLLKMALNNVPHLSPSTLKHYHKKHHSRLYNFTTEKKLPGKLLAHNISQYNFAG